MASYPGVPNIDPPTTTTIATNQLTQQYQQYQAANNSTSGAGISNNDIMGSSRKGLNHDSPPFSRVFIVCSKTMKEEDIQEAFTVFGTIEDVWMVKDRMTKENKGICYVKFERASSAAASIESLDGKVIGNDPKPIKVLVSFNYTSLTCYSLVLLGNDCFF